MHKFNQFEKSFIKYLCTSLQRFRRNTLASIQYFWKKFRANGITVLEVFQFLMQRNYSKTKSLVFFFSKILQANIYGISSVKIDFSILCIRTTEMSILWKFSNIFCKLFNKANKIIAEVTR